MWKTSHDSRRDDSQAPRDSAADCARPGRRELATCRSLRLARGRRHPLAPRHRLPPLRRPERGGAPPHGLSGDRRTDAKSHSRASHHRADSRRKERKPMKMRILVAALLAIPFVAAAQLPTQEPAKKQAAPKKDAAKGAPPIATVNGVPVPRARAETLLNQQRARGMPDNDQSRALIRDELVNREVLMQEAQKSGVARSPEV